MSRKDWIISLIMITFGTGLFLLSIPGCKKVCCTIGYRLNTDSVYSITYNSALVHVTIVADDEDTINVKGVCWSTRPSPTVSNDTTNNGYGKQAFIGNIHGLASVAMYYLRPYVTTKKGTAYGDETTFKTLKAPVFSVGEKIGGGVVFYVDSAGVRGLVAALSDESSGATWGCPGTLIPDTTKDGPGAGFSYTLAIVQLCSDTASAAWICRKMRTVYDTGDWYLPSKFELKLLYQQRIVVGGFENADYWSSSQSDKDNAWGLNFANGDTAVLSKNIKCHVRPIRAL
ncbi:MAG: DUF1566 domain-containing protein [Bacteroidetes bacterium]|nr:DUF1566 domain-containing protein [Bacteroidota bacterium]